MPFATLVEIVIKYLLENSSPVNTFNTTNNYVLYLLIINLHNPLVFYYLFPSSDD